MLRGVSCWNIKYSNNNIWHINIAFYYEIIWKLGNKILNIRSNSNDRINNTKDIVEILNLYIYKKFYIQIKLIILK